jgi:plastocyanin
MRRPPRRLVPLAVASLALLLPACGGGDGGESTAEPGHVDVIDNAFKPKTIEVAVGDTVTWDFRGGAAHNVVGDGFKSDTLGKGNTFEHTFNSAGSFGYVCTLHAGMTGTVEVG